MKTTIFSDVLNLFYPDRCIGCSKHLSYHQKLICVACAHDLPYSYYSKNNWSPVEKLFYGKIPIQFATSLLLYESKSITQKLIHELKYHKNQKIGELFGELIAIDLLNNKKVSELDYIIPVPLHANKLRKRGYNQLSKLGHVLSKKLQVPYIENLLLKTSSTETQTKNNKVARWKNAQHSFELSNTSFLENKHVLLLDDVITTGATLESCSKELLKTKKITLSICTIAHTINF